nr:hypothetical protein [Tanacetum cinerariifolium]
MKGRKPPVSTKCVMWNGLVDRVSSQEGTCSGLRDQVSGYELFKEQCDVAQDAQVKVIRHGLRLAVMKCMQSTKYVTALGTALGLAIDKGIQTGLVVGIDHGKSGRSLADVAAYDPSVEAKRFKERASSRLFHFDAKGPLVDPLYSENLVGEASTSGVLTMVFATTNAEPQLEASHFLKVLKRKSWTLHQITLRPVEPAIHCDASCFIYDTNQKKTLVPTTPLSTAFFFSSIVQDFENSPDDEEDTRSNQENMNDLEEEYQARALLAKSKSKKGYFTKECWSKTSVLSYQSPLQPKLIHSSEHKPKPRHTKDFEAKYNKVKAKLALLNSSASALSSSSGKNKGLIFELYDWDKEEVSSDNNDVTEVKAFMDLADEERVFVRKKVSKMHPFLLLEKLNDAKPVFGPKTIKSIMKSKSTFKVETLKGIAINEPSSAPARANKCSSVSKTNSASAGESSSRSRPARPAIHFPSCIHYGYNDHKSDDYVYYLICETCGNYDHNTQGHNKIISPRRGIKPRNPQHVTKNCETCRSNVYTTSDHNDIEWFKKKEALQAK